MVVGRGAVRALSITDIPWLVADAAGIDPDRPAITFGALRVTFRRLHSDIELLDAAMGGALGPETLLPLVLADLVPEALQSDEGALDRVVASLISEASGVLGLGDVVTDLDGSPKTLAQLFEACADRHPNRIALQFGDSEVTYAELDRRSNRVARSLVARGVGPESTVGLALRRSIDLVVGMYGIVKAGAAYLPLDPDHPSDRLRFVVDTATPTVILSNDVIAVGLPDGVDVVDIESISAAQVDDSRLRADERTATPTPETLAYVIFTSGSTGRPKGVAVPHSAIVANLEWRQRRYDLREDDVVLQKTPFTFDVSVWEFFWPLQVGARLVLAEPDGHTDPEYLAALVRRAGVTVVHFVPSMLAVFLEAPGARMLTSLRYVFASGEELTTVTAARFAVEHDAELHNLYGPTEAAVDVTHHHVTNDDRSVVPIGVAVDDTELRVLDAGLEPVPPGAVGELYLSGIQLARGYLARADLSAERFVADPFGAGSRMYRTGDLVKRSDENVLVYLGRTDFQVKFHGLRIELGEIESVLRQPDSVSQSVVILRGDRLVGYVVASRRAVLVVEDLWSILRSSLPGYMVPTDLVVLDSMPLGRSGKLDRASLPDHSPERGEFSSPMSEHEIEVAAEFSNLLGVDRVGRDEDFFSLGGSSLSATRLVARSNARYNSRVSVRDFFDAATVAGLAALLESAEQDRTTPKAALRAAAWPTQIPLAPAQQRMWFLNRLDPESSVDNISLAIRLSGPFDVDAMRAAIRDLVARHSALRTRYPEVEGVGTQVIGSSDVEEVDWYVASIDNSDLVRHVVEAAHEPFDVAAAPPFRVRLLEIDRHQHVLVVVAHHIAADGFSMVPLTSDIVIAYEARAAGTSANQQPLAVQYADYTLWQHAVLGSSDDPSSVAAVQERYWASALSGSSGELVLPADRQRPARWSGRGATSKMVVDPAVHQRLVELGRAQGSTLFMVVHAAVVVLLSQLSGSSDVSVGTPVAGRGEAVLDDLIGMFVNTLVLRVQVDNSSDFGEVLAHVREMDLLAFEHADVPFERIVDVVGAPRTSGRHPIYQVSLTFRDVGPARLELNGLTVEAVDFDVAVAKVDLDFAVSERISESGAANGLTVAITYATDLFDAETIESIGRKLSAVFDTVAENPNVVVGDIDLIDAAERSWLLETVNRTERQLDSSASLVSMFESQVRLSPDAVALVFEGEALTYLALDGRANQLARYLISHGVGPESPVAVCLRRSVDLLVAIYAVIKTGGAYVPLDPGQPAERIRYIVDTSRAGVVLTSSREGVDPDIGRVVLLDELPLAAFSNTSIGDSERHSPLTSGNTAYVLFTSGSTGKPKGVTVEHAAIVNRLVWMQTQYELTDADVVVQKTPVTFDVSVWELFWPLHIGARLVIARPDGHRDPVYLAELMASERVSVAHFVPSMAAVFAADPAAARARSLRWIFTSGEALQSETAAALRRVVPSARVVNLYGPTEASVDVTFHEFVDSDLGGVPIGLPVFNTRVYVLDGRLRPVSVGAVGELYLGGVQLARGYVSRPDLTSDRFVADPFGSAGSRVYRTGDLVRWSTAGELEYIGRTDFQVKLRGLRIELGEIETILLASSTVSQAVVAVRGDRLVAYVVPSFEATVDIDALTASAAAVLPHYMVPSVVMVLDALPTGSTGKLDRRSLPEPVSEHRAYRTPVTHSEVVVAAVFSELLGVTGVGLDDDFFALGGNSLVATQVVSRVGAALDTHIAVRSIFDTPTVAGLAASVASSAGSGRRVPLEPGQRPDRIPLSLAQQRMWFLDKLEPDSAAYHIPIVVRLEGELDVDALRRAIDDVRERHESLRTIYPETDGVGYQVVLPAESSPFALGITESPEAEALGLIRELLVRPYALDRSAPFRAHLYRLGGNQDILAVVVHHIAADGFSMGPLVRDIVSAYAAEMSNDEPQWDPLQVQYADYALWQRKMLGDESDPDSLISRQIDFWSRRLAGIAEQMELPTDRPRPTISTERGAVHAFAISGSLHRAVVTLGLEIGCTPFMIVHAAFAVLLARMSSSEDIAIGTPVAGRGDRALDDVIGMFVNTLVLRTEVRSTMTIRDLLTTVREDDLDAFANADVPFERLVEVLDPPRSAARQPLFQVMLAFQNLGRSSVELPGIAAAGVELETGLSKFDLYLTVSEEFDGSGDPLGMLAQFLYLTDLFDEATVAAAGARFVRILETIVSDRTTVVGDIDILTEAEVRTVVHDWNRTDPPDSDELLLDRYRSRVSASPDAVAITFEDESITYGDFDFRVRSLAGYLIAEGIGPESAVAVAVPRSVDLVVCIYAIVDAGAAYVPIDLGQPTDRVKHVLRTAAVTLALVGSPDDLADTGVRVVVASGQHVSGAFAQPTTSTTAPVRPRPDGAAYVLFTSGSTGRPKGVVVSHRAIVNRLDWMQAEYGSSAVDVVVHKTPVTFDVSLWELFWPLQIGARLVIARPDGHRDPAYLAELIRSQAVTIAHFVPSMLAVFAVEPAVQLCSSLRWIVASGEVLAPSTAREVASVLPSVRVSNLYGPTEAAVDVTLHEFEHADTVSVPIGRPMAGVRVYVLDVRLHPVPRGVLGELYLAGVQLARGYASSPGLTAERFVADPFGRGGGRLYRTGDVVRWTTTGELDYVGRSDSQVKLRGQRIETGEIEGAFMSHPDVGGAVVVLGSGPSASEALVAYVVPRAGSTVNSTDLGTWAAGLIPDYMVPTSVVVLAELPVGPNGKLDRRALPDPVFETRIFRAPSSVMEELVARTYRDLLDVDPIGLDDDFFALGGNSLSATRVVARLGVALGREIPLRMLFETPGVEGLAGRVERESGAGLRPPIGVRASLEDPVPLSLAQRSMWFLNRFEPDSGAHNIPVTIRLSGELDVDAFTAAFLDVVARHDILRTVYPDRDGVGWQIIESVDALSVGLDLVHTTGPRESAERVLELVSAGFDVTAAVPVRAALLAESATEHVLVVVAHHISMDGYSIGPLTQDLMRAYASRSADRVPDWQPPAVQYADYALWQRVVLGSEEDTESIASAQIAYWVDRLADLPTESALPMDRPRSAQVSSDGAAVTVSIDAALRARVSSFAHDAGATPFMVVHTALAVLLARLSDGDDIAIGTPVAGRGAAELDDMIGMFVNTVVLRTPIDSTRTFTALVVDSRDTALSAFAHADISFERVVDAVDPRRERGRQPLLHVVLAFQNFDRVLLQLPNLTVSGVDSDHVRAKFDLQLTVFDSYDGSGGSTGWNVEFLYATDLFDRSTVDRVAHSFLLLLSGLLDTPGRPVVDIESMPHAERDLLIQQWSTSGPDTWLLDGEVPLPRTLDGRFAQSGDANRDRTAVRFDGRSMSYDELSRRAYALARRLIGAGARPDALVAVSLPRSFDLIVALVAVSISGAGYLPVDPSYPSERNDFMIADSRPIALLAPGVTEHIGVLEVIDPHEVRSADDDRAVVAAARELEPIFPHSLAYVIYTSGSSGKPKGVAVTQSNVLRLLDNTAAEFGFNEDDVWTMFHSYAFDFSVWEMWGALLHGGTVVLVDYYMSRSPEDFRELLVAEKVTVLNQTPSAFHQLVEVDRTRPPAELSLRYILFGGEALEPRRLHTWFERYGDGSNGSTGPALVNLYGITETTVHVSMRRMTVSDVRGSSVIGTPIAGLQVYVLDRRLRPVAVGVAGELYVAGGQLARGYVARHGLSSTRFVADPFGDNGSRLYRTGDRARWKQVGDVVELEYLGRVDDQVKIRGFRIELGEVQAAVTAQPGVKSSAVVVRDVPPAGDQLVAYVVFEDDSELSIDQLRQGISTLVPAYMVPSSFVSITAVPLTANGKLDLRALPSPTFVEAEFRAPSGVLEPVVAGVYADVLGLDRVGADDDFFELGGNSLVATRVVSRLGSHLDTVVTVRMLFESSTVSALAARLESAVGSGARRELVARRRPDRIPLSYAQQRMWLSNRLQPESAVYNIAFALRLMGTVDTDALNAAFVDVVERHESLRTRYPVVDEVGAQQVMEVSDVELGSEPESVVAAELAERVRSLYAIPFDVSAAVPLRVRVLQVSEDDHVVVVVVHHIAADGFSIGPITRDLMTAYTARSQGGTPGWVPLPVQYVDYVLWHREVLGDEHDPASIMAAQINFWRETLGTSGSPAGMATDRPRMSTPSGQGASHELVIESALLASVDHSARAHNATLFMALHASVAILLARMSGDEDIAVGTPVAGRGESALDGMVGMFVNTLVLRTHVHPSATVSEVLELARDTDLDAFAHSDVPFDRVVELIDPPRSASRSPFFDVVVALQNLEATSLELPGLTVTGLDTLDHSAKYDLQFLFSDRFSVGDRAGLTCTIVYATDLYDPVTIELLAERMSAILTAVARTPGIVVGDIDISTGVDIGGDIEIAGPPTSVQRHPGGRTLPSLFDASVEAEADAPAIVSHSAEISYLEFAGTSGQLARFLASRNVGPGVRVVVDLPSSIDFVTATWAVWMCGAAVAFEADSSRVRADLVLTMGRPAAYASASSGRSSIDLGAPDIRAAVNSQAARPIDYAARTRPLSPDDDAFVIMGRNGESVLSHRVLVDRAAERALEWEITYESRTLVAVDRGNSSVWIALALVVSATEGAAVVVNAEEMPVDVVIDQAWITHVVADPSVVFDEAGVDHVIRTDNDAQAPWSREN